MSEAAGPSGTAARPARQLPWGMAILGIASGSILVPLNSTMLAVALPSVMREFHVGAGTVSWLVTLYLAATALALQAGGSLGDHFGHRRMFLLGVAGFAATSLLGAVARSFPLLIVARVLQAVSGASIGPNAASLVRAFAPEDRRGGAFGLFDMLTSTSAAVGPFVGGLLVSGFGWRSIFLIAVPFALIAALLVTAVVPRARPKREERPALDIPGLAFLSAGLLALLLALFAARAGGRWEGWALTVPVLGVLFVRRELRAPVPAVDVRLFRVRPFSAAVLGVLGATVILHATMILVPMQTQNLLRASASASGAALLGLSVLGAVVAPFGGRISDRVGRRAPVVTGSLCMAAGLAALWAWTDRATTLHVGILLGVLGVGFGLSGSPRQASAIESVPETASGMAAGTYYTGRYIGGVLGASLAGTLLGEAVTSPAVAGAFGALTLVALAVTVVSFGLRGALPAGNPPPSG